MAKFDKNIGKTGGSEADGSSQLQACRQKIKITCLLCCHLIFQRVQPVVEEEKIKTKRNAIIKNLCNELHLSKNEVPDECLEEMFPFCKGCCEKAERLWEYSEEIKRIQKKKEATLLEIRKTVTEGEVFQPKVENLNPLVVKAEAKKFKRLREMILEASRDAWRNDCQHNTDLIDESTDGSEDVEIVTQTREPLLTETTTGVPLVDYFNPIEAHQTCLSSASRPNYFKNQDAMDKNCCVFCAKSFPTNQQLMQHLPSHTREKPFTCNVCGKEFGHKGNLTRHIATHTGEPPFKCNLCFKTFIQKSDLGRHLKTHNRK